MGDDDRKPVAQVKTVIDGREVTVQRDRWALDVARQMGISIPTLCNHAALTPYGACRLCVVQVTKGKWTWLTTSCDLPIREGLSIRTNTPEVIQARRVALELLWGEAPDAVDIQELAAELGVTQPRFAPRRKKGKCILCGLCVLACRNLVGAAAIGFSNRSVTRRVGSPFEESSEACIGCQACVHICPTGHVRSVDEGNVRRMITWKTDLELAPCANCGQPFAPVKLLAYLRERMGDQPELMDVCQRCRRGVTAGRLKELSGLSVVTK